MKRLILQVLAAVFSSLLLSLALPNEIFHLGFPPAAVFALIPLYIALCTSRSYLRTATLMAVHVFTVHMVSSWWLSNFHGYGLFSLGASAAGTAFIGFCCGIILHFPFSKVSFKADNVITPEKDGLRPVKRTLIFSSLWIFWEFIKSTGALGYPWGTLSMASYNWKLVTQIADITGVWGISFLFALFNSTLAEILIFAALREKNRSFALSPAFCLVKGTAVLTALTLVYGSVQYFIPRTPVKHVNTVVVQQNIDPWEADENECIKVSKRLTDEALDAFEEQNLKCDLVLWSEGVLGRKFPQARHHYESFPQKESLSSYIKSKEIPFLIGGETLVNKKEKHNSNSAVLFDSDGEYSGFFSKMHLVPFAEKIPYSETAVMKYIMHDLVHYGSSGWTPGYQFVLFKIPVSEFKNEETPLEYGQPVFTSINLDKEGKRDYDETRHFITNKRENPRAFVRFTTPVCFEDSFSDVLTPLYNSGSEVFMNITNDSWSKKPSAEYQHFAAASFAAIQYRTTMVRCCNSGYSAVILPNGKIMADLPVFTESSMAVSVPVYERKPTVYSKYGDWAAYAVMALFFFFVLKDAYFEKLKRILKIPFAVKINVSIKKGNISDADSVTDSALSAEPKDKADSPAVPAKEKAVPEKKKTSSVKAKSVSEKKNTSKKTADKKTVVKKESEKTSVNKPASGKNTAKKTASEKKAPVVKKEAAKKTSPGKTVSASKKAPAKRKS